MSANLSSDGQDIDIMYDGSISRGVPLGGE